MTPPKAKAKLDRTLDDDELDVAGGELAETPELELGVLGGAGMAGIDYERRRYGMAGAGFVATAAAKAEEARGNEPGDLIVLSIPPGGLAAAMAFLEELGVRRPVIAD